MRHDSAKRPRSIEPLERRMLLCAWPHDVPPPQPAPSGLRAPVPPTLTWQTAADNPLIRFEAQGALVNGKLYVLGGFFNTAIQATTRSDVYDPATNMWSPIADMPEPITHAGQAVDGALIYVAGGFLGNHPGGSVDFVRVYNTSNNTWSNGPSLPDDRGGGALVRLGRELHYFGGATRQAGINDYIDFGTHWVFQLGPTASQNDDANSWTTAEEMPNPRNHIGGAAVGGKIYVVGGQHQGNENSGNQSSVHVYTPGAGWSAVADMPRPLGHITASTFEFHGRMMVIGGVTQGAAKVANVIEYDPPTNTWVALPSLPGPRQSPVAGAIGAELIVSTGADTGAIFGTTWRALVDETWETNAANATANIPVALGEVASGVIGKYLYVVGQNNSATMRYDLSTNQWSPANTLAVRQFPGNHHASEVVNGKFYLFGGLGSSSGGKVQIYDPVTNMWGAGADMPFAAGSSSSVLINGEVYVAGGIIGSSTTTQVAKYNPGTNMWTPLAAMPQGRNHTAAATDGQRMFIFGGRGPGSGDGNMLANGFSNVQIYNPQTNTWESSLDAGSTLAPLPQARGGMGKAVYINGEFYVIGGETLNGPGATPQNVYNRVDIYNPVTNTWRLGTPTPTARHGIFPVAHAGRIYIAAGGVQAAASNSAILEIHNVNDVVAPSVTAAAFHYETAPLRVMISFSEDVSASIEPADLSVQRLGGDPAFNPDDFTYDGDTRTITFELPTPLSDGNYRATLSSAGVADSSGNILPADFTLDFFVLAGDANRDRDVDISDLAILASHWQWTGRSFSQGNFDYSPDGLVSVSDLGILASNWQASLAPPSAPAPGKAMRAASRLAEQVLLP